MRLCISIREPDMVGVFFYKVVGWVAWLLWGGGLLSLGDEGAVRGRICTLG